MSSHPRILVVDDEASLRRQLTVGLTQHGYEVDECEAGLPALAKIRTARSTHDPFRSVVLDVRLPDIDGLKILSVIKSTYPDLPVVIITGYGNEDTVNTVQSCEGNGYLDKPFEMDALVSELDRIGARVEEEPKPAAVTEAHVLASAVVFLRGSQEADLSAMYARLNFGEGVCYCDPVLGDWDLALLLQAPHRNGIEGILKRHLEGLKDVDAFEIHHCEKPGIGREFEEFIEDYEKARAMGQAGSRETARRGYNMHTSYAVLDVDPGVLHSLYMKLYFTDNVVHCDVVDGGTRIILLMQGVSPQVIQTTLRNEIRFMPGVLRIKQLNVLNFAVK
jgi:CheY-like chemotaxis protein